MRTEKIEFIIPSHLIPALVNGDTSGLDDDEIQAIEGVEQQAADCMYEAGGTHYCWGIPKDQSSEFEQMNDATGYGACDCLRVNCTLFIEENEEMTL